MIPHKMQCSSRGSLHEFVFLIFEKLDQFLIDDELYAVVLYCRRAILVPICTVAGSAAPRSIVLRRNVAVKNK